MSPPARFRNAAIIYNPAAGRRRSQREREIGQACELLEAGGIRCTLAPTTGPGNATELARNQTAAGRDLIIVCGGDGTVNEAVNGMAGSQVPLALLPAGTANILAKELRLPWNIVQAAEYIPHGEVRRIALGRAGDRHFICIAGAGADAAVIRNFNRYGASKARLGMLLGVIEGFRQLFTYGFPKLQVDVGGESLEAAQVLALRSREQSGPIRVAQTAGLFKNHLEVVVFPARSRWYFLAAFLADLGGTLPQFPGVRYFDAETARVSRLRDPVGYEVDGEWAGEIPVEFSVVPDALSLVVPSGRDVNA